MSVETTYYIVDWNWFVSHIEQTKSMEFFWEILDDDEADTCWEKFIIMPDVELMESWRQAENLNQEIFSCQKLLDWNYLSELKRLMIDMAIIPDDEKNRFFPISEFAELEQQLEDYLGAISPDQVKDISDRMNSIPSTEFEGICKSEAEKNGIYNLTMFLKSYNKLLKVARSKGWGIVITVS